MSRIAAPALIVMLMVAGLLAAAGWNAADEPRLMITLTERELPLVVADAPEGDDPGLQLGISYQPRYDPLDSRNWLGESRLRAIGFALYIPAGTPQAQSAYDHVPPRHAWIVFEYDGPAWREVARRAALRTEGGEPPAFVEPSRLVPVDAGPDFDALLQRYPSGHLIMRAVFGLGYEAGPDRSPIVFGTLREVVPRRVSVPTRMRELLDPLPPARPGAAVEPRYEADLAIGALGVPYLRALRLRP